MLGLTKKQETIAKINDMENIISFLKKLNALSINSAMVSVKNHSASSSKVSKRKLTGLNPSLHEIIADFLFFIHPS